MRYEYKYVVPLRHMEEIRKLIVPFLELDKFAEVSNNSEYTVRSIYFDSPAYDFYFEKIDGIKNRKKVRLRGYDEYSPDNKVFLEIKRKYEIPILKFRAPIQYKEAVQVLKEKSLNGFEHANIHDQKKLDNTKRFFYQIFSNNLRPVVLVVYEREAYLSKFDRTVRVTFDKDLRGMAYPALEELYEEEPLLPVMRDSFIIEVKFNKSFPKWMAPILAKYDLKRRSASKYVFAMNGSKVVKHLQKSTIYTHSKWYQ